MRTVAAVVAIVIATAAVTALLLLPRRSAAVGGLSLQDRIVLSGTPRGYYYANRHSEPAVVPEGRRLFVYDVRFEFDNRGGLVCHFGGQLLAQGGYDARTVSLSSAVPILLRGGDRIAPECTLGGEPNDDIWSNLRIKHAYEL